MSALHIQHCAAKLSCAFGFQAAELHTQQEQSKGSHADACGRADGGRQLRGTEGGGDGGDRVGLKGMITSTSWNTMQHMTNFNVLANAMKHDTAGHTGCAEGCA